MKNESGGVKIDKFIGLKSEIYSLISYDGKEINKANGLNLKLRHKEYVDVLSGKKFVRQNEKNTK